MKNDIDNNYSDDDYSNDYGNYSNEHENFEPDDSEYEDYKNFKKSIIYLGESLRYIVNDMEINVVHGDTKVNLLDYLPLFKKGYTTKDSFKKIFIINQYLYHTDPDIEGYESPDDYLDHYLGLYQSYEESMKVSPIEILSENNLIEQLYENYNDYEINIDGDIKLKSFLSHIDYVEGYEWVDLLLKSKLKLYIAVIIGYEWMIKDLLTEIDPRNYNNEAYHLAVEIGIPESIELIKNKIIELNWLEKQALIKEFNKYDFISDDIISYYQSRKH